MFSSRAPLSAAFQYKAIGMEPCSRRLSMVAALLNDRRPVFNLAPSIGSKCCVHHHKWIHGFAEDAPLAGPYALIVAGASLHWMAWDVVLPRFRGMLTPRRTLVIVEYHETPKPWDADLGATSVHESRLQTLRSRRGAGVPQPLPHAWSARHHLDPVQATPRRGHGVIPRPQWRLARSHASER